MSIEWNIKYEGIDKISLPKEDGISGPYLLIDFLGSVRLTIPSYTSYKASLRRGSVLKPVLLVLDILHHKLGALVANRQITDQLIDFYDTPFTIMKKTDTHSDLPIPRYKLLESDARIPSDIELTMLMFTI